MADEAQVLRAIDWRESFPFTHLFRAFRVAIHPSKLVLALLALLLLYAGGRVLDGLWLDRYLVPAVEIERYGARVMTPAGSFPAMVARVEQEPRGIFMTFFRFEAAQVDAIAAGVISGEWGVIPVAVANFVILGPAWLITQHPLYFTLYLIWFLIIWSVFGGAISRIAAVHVARDEKISVRQAIRFSAGKFLSFLFAPLIPVMIIFAVGLVLAAAGLLMYIPVAGPIVLALAFILALGAGFVITLVLLGTIGGFNLMYPTIAVEGSDSFDAISRSFSYVYARPWRMLFYTLVAIVYGALCYLFVRFFLWVMLLVTHAFTGWFLRDGTAAEGLWDRASWDNPAAAIWGGPPGFWKLTYDVNYAGLNTAGDIAAGIMSFWIYLVIAMLGAFAVSFYFSANTIIYYLMRREVDTTELDDVDVEQSDEDFSESAPVTSPAPATAGETGPAGPAVMVTPATPPTMPPAGEPAQPPSSEQNPPPAQG